MLVHRNNLEVYSLDTSLIEEVQRMTNAAGLTASLKSTKEHEFVSPLDTTFAILIDATTLGNALQIGANIRQSSDVPLLFLTDSPARTNNFSLQDAYGLEDVDHFLCPVDPVILQAKLQFWHRYQNRQQHLSYSTSREAAIHSEGRFESLVLATSKVVWTTNHTGAVVADSPSWRQYTGQTFEQWKDAGWLTALHPDDRERAAKQWQDCIRTGAIYEIEYRVRRIDGQYRWHLARAVPVYHDDGSVLEWVGANADITDAKHADDKLRQSEYLYRAIAANLPNGAVFVVDADYRYRLADGTALREVGMSSSEIEGRTIFDVFGRDETAQGIRDYRAVLAGEPFRREHEVRGRHFVSHGTPIKGANDDRYTALVVSYDITERKHAEERLQLLDRISEATREAGSAHAIMTVTTRMLAQYLGATRCAYADVEQDSDRFTIRQDWHESGTQSTVGEYSLQLFGSRAVADLYSGHPLILRDIDKELLADNGADMFNAIGIKAIICCPLVKDDRLVAMMAVHQSKPRSWSDGEIGLVEAVVERSWAHIERVRATEALREADRRKDEFLAMLAHELRNPLAPLSAGLQLLRMTPHEQPGTQKTLDIMERQLGHMVHLINDLLDISRINQGKISLKREIIKIDDVARSACEVVLPKIEARRQHLSISLTTEALHINADATRMAQVLSNLLNNASKYTADDGTIALSTQLMDGRAVIEVTDNGMGIPREMLSKIFGMFTQVDRNMTRSHGGLGIGLALARQLVEMHGGEISAQSPGIDLGSTFRVEMPVVAPPEQVTGDSSDAPPSRPMTVDEVTRRLLIIDDNVDAAETLATLLRVKGHEVVTAHTGLEGLELACKTHIELVFVDIGLPDISGNEVARTIKAARDNDKTVLVAITGWGSEDNKRESQMAGFDLHLTKPVSRQQIEDALKLLR